MLSNSARSVGRMAVGRAVARSLPNKYPLPSLLVFYSREMADQGLIGLLSVSFRTILTEVLKFITRAAQLSSSRFQQRRE